MCPSVTRRALLAGCAAWLGTPAAALTHDGDALSFWWNRERRRHGLRAVRHHRALHVCALTYSRDLARRGALSHVGEDGRRFDARMRAAGYAGAPRAENLAWNQPDARRVFAAWLESPPHREALMLRDIDDFGLGRVDAANGVWWTLVMGRGRP